MKQKCMSFFHSYERTNKKGKVMKKIVMIVSITIICLSLYFLAGCDGIFPPQPTPTSTPTPTSVFFDDFNGQTSGAYPENWTCHDYRSGSTYCDISGPHHLDDEYVRLMDHQGGEYSGMYQSFDDNVVNGTFQFDMHYNDYATGSSTFETHAILESANGTDIIDINLIQNRDGDYWNLDVNGNSGTTSFSPDTRYLIKVVFDNGLIAVWVNSTLEHSGISYTSSAIEQVNYYTAVSSHGTNCHIDNVNVSS